MAKNNRIFPEIREPLLFGHRGYSRLAPENTMAAFRLLVKKNIPGVELDVHLCDSGELVVIHDHNLSRLAGWDAVVENAGYKDLRFLDIGSHFDSRFKGERIPLLDEVFEELGHNVYYDIELKHKHRDSGELEKKVITAIRRQGLEERCLISSFNPFSMKTCRLQGWKRTAIIYCKARNLPWYLRHGEGRLISGSPICKPEWINLKYRPFYLFRHPPRYPILAWSVDTREQGKILLQRGVSGLISNDPAVHLETLAAFNLLQ